jgi:hypothetical protein
MPVEEKSECYYLWNKILQFFGDDESNIYIAHFFFIWYCALEYNASGKEEDCGSSG